MGYILTGEGRKIDPEKTKVIDKFPEPKSVSELKTFLGMMTFCRKFVKDFATIAAPLYNLTKKNVVWSWSSSCQEAFAKLKEALTSAPVLMCPDVNLPYRLYTDASGTGMGASLCQEIDGQERVIAYASQHFNMREQKYSTIEKEAAAVVWAVGYFRPY